jgi:hypothetical protein
MCIRLHVRYSLFLSDFNGIYKFSTDFRQKKNSNIKFNQNPSSGSRVVPRGLTDTTKLISFFANFRTRLKNVYTCSVYTKQTPLVTAMKEIFRIAAILLFYILQDTTLKKSVILSKGHSDPTLYDLIITAATASIAFSLLMQIWRVLEWLEDHSKFHENRLYCSNHESGIDAHKGKHRGTKWCSQKTTFPPFYGEI